LVKDDTGAALAGASVTAMQNGVVRAQAAADFTGGYALASLPEGTYQVQAALTGYLTVNSYGVTLSANQSVAQNFSLSGKPAAPVVVTATVPPPAAYGPFLTGTLEMFNGSGFVPVPPNYTVDQTKPTVILTHGWNSDSTYWPTDMAKSMMAGGANTNILAWDWRQEADTGLSLGALSESFNATPREGEKLGQALAAAFTPAYNQGVHFIGHSLGTLVNATAANYLHEQTGGVFVWLPNKTQITLLDDAAIANFAGTFVQLSYALPGVYAPYQLGSLFTCGWISPIPRATVRWMDNYISLVGGYHAEAVNTFLAKAPDYADKSDPVTFVTGVHNYACRWYGETAATPNQSLLGNRYSFEQLGSSAQFPSYPLGSFFSQDLASGQELALTQLQTADEINAVVNHNAAAFGVFGVQSSLNFAVGVAQKIGSVAADVGMSFIPHTPAGTPVYTGTAGSTPAYYTESPVETLPMWSFQVNLQTQPAPNSSLQPAPANGIHPMGGPPPAATTNQPACIWIPVQIPTNAAIFSFDFTFNGDPANDLLSTSINGTNVFALEARFMPTNTALNSGPIDVSSWAGQTVELFFGLLGGTSTNATVNLDGMRFYNVVAPFLTVQVSGTNAIMQWPISAGGYVLETREEMAVANSWMIVTNVPAIVNFQNTVTNPVSSGARFYRLKK
jgi:pimeloyl-ACP methyl ester carboxylesterase